MKKIPEPSLKNARILTAAELNGIHFAGNHTPLTPDKIRQLGKEANSSGQSATPISNSAK